MEAQTQRRPTVRTCASLDGVCAHQRGQTPAQPAEGLQNQRLGRERETGTARPLPSALCSGQAVEDPTAMPCLAVQVYKAAVSWTRLGTLKLRQSHGSGVGGREHKSNGKGGFCSVWRFWKVLQRSENGPVEAGK